MKKIFLVYSGLLVIIFLNGCNQRKGMLNTLKQFTGTEIVIPEQFSPKRYNNTQPDTTLLQRSVKMIVYLNQQGCEGCKLRGLWPLEIFITECYPFDAFGVVIILHPSSIEMSNHMLEQMFYGQTVFYDLDGSFERLNLHLPKDSRFHTFLLDENNKVILVGNPVGNAKLRNLYLTEIRKRHP